MIHRHKLHEAQKLATIRKAYKSCLLLKACFPTWGNNFGKNCSARNLKEGRGGVQNPVVIPAVSLGLYIYVAVTTFIPLRLHQHNVNITSIAWAKHYRAEMLVEPKEFSLLEMGIEVRRSRQQGQCREPIVPGEARSVKWRARSDVRIRARRRWSAAFIELPRRRTSRLRPWKTLNCIVRDGN